jgi:hypothetical protein
MMDIKNQQLLKGKMKTYPDARWNRSQAKEPGAIYVPILLP